MYEILIAIGTVSFGFIVGYITNREKSESA
jgi:hypothetical protein